MASNDQESKSGKFRGLRYAGITFSIAFTVGAVAACSGSSKPAADVPGSASPSTVATTPQLVLTPDDIRACRVEALRYIPTERLLHRAVSSAYGGLSLSFIQLFDMREGTNLAEQKLALEGPIETDMGAVESLEDSIPAPAVTQDSVISSLTAKQLIGAINRLYNDCQDGGAAF